MYACMHVRAVVNRQSPGKDIQCYNCGKYEHYGRHCFRNKGYYERKHYGERNQNSRFSSQSHSHLRELILRRMRSVETPVVRKTGIRWKRGQRLPSALS
jgi:hypothetical protein